VIHIKMRWVLVAVGTVLAVLVPLFLGFYYQGLATDAAITALLALSLVVLMGFVGQVSFCQYSFGVFGGFTVGSLVIGHGVNYWLALGLGTLFAATVGLLLGIPALRLRGLLLSILTIAFALFVDGFVLAPGIWDGFSGGANGWSGIQFPSLFGIGLNYYSFYVFSLGVLLLASLLVWNLRTGKAGRVLRAVRDSEVAASTLGLNVSLWKLGAFGLSAGLAGLAGALLVVANTAAAGGPGSAFNFQHSIELVAALTVFGSGLLFSAPLVGIFVIFGQELLDHTPLSHQWFPFILGALLVAQLVFTPDGVVAKTQSDIRHLMHALRHRRQARPSVVGSA